MSNTATAAAASSDSPRCRRLNSAAAVVHAAALPGPLGELVLAVTGKCRLWRSERTEVACELCAHFLDGLEAGAIPADLAASFGDTRHAARLITATRKRLRPLWWRTSRAAMRGLGAFLLLSVVLYAALAARFFLSSPKVTHNYMAELNVPVLQVPVADRAWPLYIDAKKQFGPLPEFMVNSRGGEPHQPGDENWDQMSAWLDAHGDALATVRAGAARPALGFVYRANIDPDLARVLEITSPGYTYDPPMEPSDENPLVIGILLPHLGEMRRLARFLSADAHLAISREDASRYFADLDALLGMAEQVRHERFTISTLVGLAIADLATAVALHGAGTPDFLTPEQLRDLAHTLGGFADGRVSIDSSVELLTIEDILQRFFSDDGNGDGHFVGGPEVDSLYRDWGLARPGGLPLLRAIQPVQSTIMPSRAQIMDQARRFVAAAAADDALPPWRHDERSSDMLYQALMESGVYPAVPFLSSLTGKAEQGPVASACASRDIFEARRHAAMTVLAMQAYRSTRNTWPSSLRELVPAYMPSLPVDPFDGQPMRYIAPASGSELPLLYSIGVDGLDEGGKPPTTKSGRFGVHNLYWLGKFRTRPPLTGAQQQQTDAARGDWVLWPEPPPVTE